jgi:hypothetical protein
MSREIRDEIKKEVVARLEKEEALKALAGENLNYQIIKDLVNSAFHNVLIEVVLKDGSIIRIRKEDPYAKIKAEVSLL